MKNGLSGLIVLALVLGCTSSPKARLGAPAPEAPDSLPTAQVVYVLPSPAWPIRLGWSAPLAGTAVAQSLPRPSWTPGPPVAVAAAEALSVAPIPLPQVLALPVKAAPGSRSWTAIGQAKPSVTTKLPTPSPAAATAATTKPKAEAKPATVAAAPVTSPTTKVPAPATAAATATLLPADTAEAADFQWQDVNAASGDSVTLHFQKTNWLYLDSPAQQKTLGFQSIARDKDATTFVFKPLIPGQYVLEFQRQDLTNQSTDVRKVKLTVVKAGTRTSSTTTAMVPQTSNQAANDTLEASRALAAAGKTSEAVAKLLQGYKADDARINLELARLLNKDGQDDEALSYLDKNLTLTGPDFQGTLELGTRLAASREPQKKLPAYVKLWSAGSTPPPEDLYIQVFETLRVQKMAALIKDWSSRYGLWYPAPKLRDRYLYQLGQWLEEPGESRDVKSSWKAYNEVVQSYPLSPFWKASGERAAYLNRHFLQVR